MQFNWIFYNYSPGSLGSRALVKGNEECGLISCHRRSLVFVSFICSRDYLQITNEKNRVFGKYCGHKTAENVLVSGKYALIKFHSDGSVQSKGFLMKFSAVMPPCKI